MNIQLRDILREMEEPVQMKTQIYMDLDGVLVDLETGFEKISGGYSPKDLHTAPEFQGKDPKLAKRRFWQLINGTPNFWETLPIMPDAKVLWSYVQKNFLDPKPVVLTAGQGKAILDGKTKWVNKNLGQNITVMLAPMGSKKPEFIIEQPNTRHILIDDTTRNIEAWNNPTLNRFAILHKNAAESIRFLNELTQK